MKLNAVPDARRSQLSGFIADSMGLHFPCERWPDLQRGLAAAADEFGFADVAGCADWLLSTPLTKAQLQVLASHLTVGETYFFRERRTFEVLANSILPELIRSRRGRERRLRLWSAGCCTGEEPYSLAMLLHQALPDIASWHVTILATDINVRFLGKAMAGSYGEWSFRGAPDGLKERYFIGSPDGRHVVRPEIKEMVTFAPFNLVEDTVSSPAGGTNAMDLIFCRNVLMYFTPTQTRKVVGNFHRALGDGGWLAVSPSEASQALFPQFVTRNFPGTIIYQKSDVKAGGHQPSPLGEAPEWFRPAPEPPPTPRPEKPAPAETGPTPAPPPFSLLARALANQGKLADALTWCDRWIAADKLASAGHYLRAIVLLEQGDPEQARRSLQRAVYLDPDFVLAHFALGNLARGRGKTRETDKHFGNALRLLGRQQPDDLLPESDGLTAGRLADTINALAAQENVP